MSHLPYSGSKGTGLRWSSVVSAGPLVVVPWPLHSVFCVVSGRRLLHLSPDRICRPGSVPSSRVGSKSSLERRIWGFLSKEAVSRWLAHALHNSAGRPEAILWEGSARSSTSIQNQAHCTQDRQHRGWSGEQEVFFWSMRSSEIPPRFTYGGRAASIPLLCAWSVGKSICHFVTPSDFRNARSLW